MKVPSSARHVAAESAGESGRDSTELTDPSPEPLGVSRQIIRTIRITHCKRGPAACEQCRIHDAGVISLLDLHLPGRDGMQRRLIEVERQGEKAWYEYDILRAFDTSAEATSYADEHGLEDAQF